MQLSCNYCTTLRFRMQLSCNYCTTLGKRISTFAKFRVVQLSLQVNLAKKRQRGKQKKTLTYLPGLISNVLGRALEMYLTGGGQVEVLAGQINFRGSLFWYLCCFTMLLSRREPKRSVYLNINV